jgi:hypothetical protein
MHRSGLRGWRGSRGLGRTICLWRQPADESVAFPNLDGVTIRQQGGQLDCLLIGIAVERARLPQDEAILQKIGSIAK